MKSIALVILGGALSMLLFSCEDQQKKEDMTQTINKNGAVETAIQVEHLDSTRDVLVTTHHVWVHNELAKTFIYRDTLPALGKIRTTAENANGDTMPVTVKKDYEIFITVK